MRCYGLFSLFIYVNFGAAQKDHGSAYVMTSASFLSSLSRIIHGGTGMGIALRLKGQGKKVRVVTLITRIYSEVAGEIYKFRERRR